MTLDEAIKHCEEIAKQNRELFEKIGISSYDEDNYNCLECAKAHDQLAEWLRELKQLREQTRWIPVKWHEITEGEREREGCPAEYVTFLDNLMPDDKDEILVTVKNRRGQVWVEKDTCMIDDGYYLDSGYDWIDDVIAWMPLPEPYNAECEG